MFANGITTGIFALLAGSQLAAAHMEISYPPPFRSKFNPHATNIDYTNTAPLADNGSNYPCKLYHQDIGTPAGASVATFAPGGHYNFTVAGAAPHNGGSCQVSLSYDNGKTFTVIKSFLGGCPREAGNYFFDIPADAPQGPAIWAWTWQNQIGNREQYMNCASVTIGGGAARREAAALKPRVAFSARPQVFLANIGNGCSTTEGTDVKYPNPGPDVEELDTSKLAPPVGNCGPVSSGSDNGSGSGNTTPEEPTTSAAQVTAAPTTTSVDLPGGIFITDDEEPATPTTAPVAAPTTLTTVTTTASSSEEVATPTAAPDTGSDNNAGNGASGSGFAPGSPCSDEGAWNCVGGTSFQRCASGSWSAVLQLAAGTKCTPGASTFAVESVNAKRTVRRWRSAKMRFAA